MAPFVSKLFGLDISENMINEYKSNIQEAGYGDKVVARNGDLFADPVPADISGPEYSDFDPWPSAWLCIILRIQDWP